MATRSEQNSFKYDRILEFNAVKDKNLYLPSKEKTHFYNILYYLFGFDMFTIKT